MVARQLRVRARTRTHGRACMYIFISRKTSRKIPSRNFWRGMNGWMGERLALLASNRRIRTDVLTDKITLSFIVDHFKAKSTWLVPPAFTRIVTTLERSEYPLKISIHQAEKSLTRNFTRVERGFERNRRCTRCVQTRRALNGTFPRYPLKYGVNYQPR